MCRKFLKDESGATAIEYGVLAAVMAIGCLITLEATGNSIAKLFDNVSGKLSSKLPK